MRQRFSLFRRHFLSPFFAKAVCCRIYNSRHTDRQRIRSLVICAIFVSYYAPRYFPRRYAFLAFRRAYNTLISDIFLSFDTRLP